jgi:Uma2 family endonuclease
MGKRPATYQDVLDAPEGVTAELIDGELFLLPAPLVRHQRANARITSTLDRFDAPGGWWIFEGVELWLGRPDPKTKILVPDVSGWRRERFTPAWDTHGVDTPPDWVCEVLSPGNFRHDRIVKLPHYAAAGVAHVWIVDPAERSVEVFELRDGVYALVTTATGDDEAVLPPFSDALPVGRWWLPAPDAPPSG